MKNLGTCGINCDKCKFKLDGSCGGCFVIKGKPFWGVCEWYACAHSKGFDYCCCCEIFPCDRMKEALIGEGGEKVAMEAINDLKELHKTHAV